ncbi:serine carboxypeptidase, partial [Cooperia oncophora]
MATGLTLIEIYRTMNVLVLCLLISLTSAAPEWEQIKSLPNLVEPLRSKHYAGYVQVSQTKQLFYWYIESENDPANDPLVLFLNGGPGCSSLQGLVSGDGTTEYANIIYLDAPAGVGFSIRLDGLWDYTDTEVALDNYAAMKEWFKKFPERMTNDFYAAGESYAGTYIPMLSAILVDDKSINFKGMLIGNGCVDDVLNFNSLVDFNYNHGFIDERYYRQSIEKCCNNTPEHCNFYGLSMNETGFCYNEVGFLVASYLNSANFYTGLDPYFIYYSCYLDSNDAPIPTGVATVTLRSHFRRKWKKKGLILAQ